MKFSSHDIINIIAMYKRSILDYFHVHEPTKAKKNWNEEPEDVHS